MIAVARGRSWPGAERWSMVFPLGMLCAASQALGSAGSLPAVARLGRAAAWIALAAAYDRLARFDLADRAYKMAIRLAGETTEILNNQGYSYMLRGDLRAARGKFEQALQREPNNPTILNNLQLLNGSYRTIQRNPG